jgi:hypothetical protein
MVSNGEVEKVEGERPAPQVVVLIEWPSKEAADEFYASEEYRPLSRGARTGRAQRFLAGRRRGRERRGPHRGLSPQHEILAPSRLWALLQKALLIRKNLISLSSLANI